MYRPTHRQLTASSLISGALLGVLAFALLAAPAFAESSCEKATAWVEANLDPLPQNLEDFADVPAEYRGAAFMALPADQRSALWTAHLDRFRSEHPELSTEELAYVETLNDLFERTEGLEETADVDLLREIVSEFGPAVGGERLNVLPAAIRVCNCDCLVPNCFQAFCIATDWGCGPTGQDGCACLYQ